MYLMFRVSGSAIPSAMIPGTISAIVTLLIEAFVPHEYMDRLLQHPYPFQPFAYVAAFVLVFRTNVAYNRFWECTTSVTMMASKMGDACVEAITFDELINTNKRLYGADGAKWLETRRRYQALMVRRFSLLHALALQYLRRDDCLTNLIPSSGRNPSVSLGLGAFGGMDQPVSRADPKWQQLEVLGGVTPSELANLRNSPDRVSFVFAQILHLSNQRRADGGLGADAPVLSRYYQLLSDGMLGFRQARKVEDIPFPWPYTQAVSAMLFLFAFIFPLVLSHFANCGADRTCDHPTYWIGPFLSFITVTGYVTLHQVARALEDPFVHPPNDLPATALQAAFNCRMLTTFDAIRRPADDVSPHSPRSPSSKANLAIDENSEASAEGSEDDESALWGEYAELEDKDVMRATSAFLHEWRVHGKAGGTVSWDGKGQVSTPRLVKMSSRQHPGAALPGEGLLMRNASRNKSPTLHRAGTSPNFKVARNVEMVPGNQPV